MCPPSGAPLRNLDKDMKCALGDLRSIINSRTASMTDEETLRQLNSEFPVFSRSAEEVSRACSESAGLANGPFLSLIELLRPKKIN